VYALCLLAQLRRDASHHGEAEALLGEALDTATAAGDQLLVARVLGDQAVIAMIRGQNALAIRLEEKCIPIYRQFSNWQELIWSLGSVGHIYQLAGDPAASLPLLEEALQLAVEVQHPQGEAWIRVVLGCHHYLAGDFAASRRELTTADALLRQTGDLLNGQWALNTLARVALAEGKRSEAHSLLTESLDMSLQRDTQLYGISRHLIVLAAACGDDGVCPGLLGCRAALPGEPEMVAAWDAADLAWAEDLARQKLGLEAFERLFAEGAGSDPNQLLRAACARIDPTRPAGALLPQPWTRRWDSASADGGLDDQRVLRLTP
jgi:tetratricopeptide (TPR) repeat protein